MLGEHKGREKNIVYGRLFQKIHILHFDGRKSQIWRTLVHFINIFIKLNFHNASNKGIYLQKKSKQVHGIKSTMQWFNFAKLAIFKVALLHQCMELKNVFNKKISISIIVKVPFSKNIHGMTQCPPNPEFTSIKVQNVDFLKKPSVDNIFFSSLMFSQHVIII